MGRLVFRDERRQSDHEVGDDGARLGRESALEIVLPEEETLVSALHAKVWREADDSWWVQDLGSTNGTWRNGTRTSGPERLRTGDTVSLGQAGPVFKVRIAGEVARTAKEPALELAQPLVVLRRVAGGEDLRAAGETVIVGRAASCSLPLRTVVDTVVSGRHAEIKVAPDGTATITDLGSKNGTWVNGQRIAPSGPLRVADRIMLGWHGPLLEVRALGPLRLADGEGAAYRPERQPAKTLVGMVHAARSQAQRAARRGTVVFLREMARQVARESSLTLRASMAAMAVLTGAAIVLAYRAGLRETRAAEARLNSAQAQITSELHSAARAQRDAEAEIERLERALTSATAASVPRAVVDSITRLLHAAEARTDRLTAAGAGGAGVAGGAERADFVRVSEQNQNAVGLVIARYASDSVMGTGFVITPSGYLLTNHHVVADESRGRPRSVEVVMADQDRPLLAYVVAVSTAADQDVAVLRIQGYRGPYVRSVDWSGSAVRQGAPAALIGFPRGFELALDATGRVRTSMTAGIISKATPDQIQYAGFTVAGTSGSPIFNADGAVIAIHHGGLAGSPGLGFSLPIGRVRAWLPAAARAELGL